MGKTFVRSGWDWVVILLLVCTLGLWFERGKILRLFVGGGPSPQNILSNNLRMLEGAKEQFVLNNRLAATSVVTRAAVENHLVRGWPRSVAKEEYVLGRVEEPVRARLVSPFRNWPAGTVLCIGSNGTLVEVK